MRNSRLNEKTRSILDEMWLEARGKGSSLSFKIASGSMRPINRTGNTVRVRRVQPSEIRTGDIVAFQEDRHVVVHRVIGKVLDGQQTLFRHMGDAGLLSGTMSARNIIGRVISVNRDGQEIILDKTRYILDGKIMVWRSRLVDRLNRVQSRYFRKNFRFIAAPVWRLYRNMLWRG